ncbi:hypothetical protein [Treponema zioleckii]|uniref:hypothetical protein n=1 Tax=Treponema zioleckii TaxID=331680 RepID=UPI00168BF310|nr:hypothetical protein [Treponema zioleckii]
MKREIFLTARFEISKEMVKNIKKMISGKFSYAKSFVILNGITNEEGDNVLSYLRTIGDFEITNDFKYYEDEELMEFDFFYCTGQIKPDTGIRFIDFEFEMNGNASFDYTNYCPKCKEGLKQISPFVVKGLSKKYAAKKFVNPFWAYWIVSSEFMEKIQQHNISGVEFWELLNYKGEASKTNFQMKPTRILQNVLDLKYIKFSDEDCNCINHRVCIPDTTVRLHKEAEASLLDFNELYEHNSSKLTGMYIISKKLLKIFIEEGIRPHWDIDIDPVEFV